MASAVAAGECDFTLRDARVPAAFLQNPTLGRGGPEQLVACDISIADGRVAAITAPTADRRPDDMDLRQGQVWPLFLDVHTHLDKGHIWSRAPNIDGTHLTAAQTVARDRAANWRHEDIELRFEFGLRCAYAHGTGAIRTHIDSYEASQAKTSWGVFDEMSRRWRDRITLQGVCMTRLDAYEGEAGLRLVKLVASCGGLLGGILKVGDSPTQATPERIDAGLDRLFQLARDFRLDVDLHIDESGDPDARTLEQVARAVLRHRFEGQVTCGHCCSLAVQSDEIARATITLVREARLNIVSLPMVNQYLQGRARGTTPRWRGITLVHELAAAGVPVAIASDNCRDPFYAFGDHDMLEVYREFVRIAHADAPEWIAAVMATPARIMRIQERPVIAVGSAADMVLFKGRTLNELLSRPQHDRIVLRKGAAIDTTLPDYCELDGIGVKPRTQSAS